MASKNIYIPQPEDLAGLEKSLSSAPNTPIIARHPLTLSSYDIQRLISLSKQPSSSHIQVLFPYRLHPETEAFHYQVFKKLSSGAQVVSISMHSINNSNESSNVHNHIVLDHIDLISHLTSQDIVSVQSLGEGTSKKPSFSLLAGGLANGGTFSLHFANQPNVKNVTNVQVSLSTGEALSACVTIPLKEVIESEVDAKPHGTLQDAAKALRVYSCAISSLETGKKVFLKNVGDKVIPIRTVGTAKFLKNGLFVPVSTSDKVALTGSFSTQTDKIKQIFNERIQEGEPFEYYSSYEQLFSNSIPSSLYRPIIYIPSLPGSRKNNEMLEALKSGYIVLAEKPAFANADLAKTFLSKLEKEYQKRLFFGWHYQHHFVFRKLVQDVNNNTFGKIKHVRTYFVAPKVLLPGVRIFNPSQGGAGLDIHSYNLHYTLRLIGFNHGFEVVESKIDSAQKMLDPANEELASIDFTLDTKLKFSNGATADLYATFNQTSVLHTEAEVLFEDGTRIFCKEYCHPQTLIRDRAEAVLIYRAGGVRWESYLSDEEKKDPEYLKTSYERQIEFVRKQATGEGNYDVVENDADGLGVEANVKLHEILDEIFVAGGFAKKTGA